MKSVNNIFVDLEDKVVKRYRKAVVSAVSGIRSDPYKGGYHRLEFVLQSKYENYNQDTGELTFVYEDDVIELYSADEDKIFRQLNAHSLRTGNLVPYEGERVLVDTSSSMSDEEITELAAVKNLLQFKKRLSELTSGVTLRRIKEAITKADRPVSFLVAVEDRIKEL